MNDSTTILLYLVFALGGVGVYLMMPKAGRSQTIAGALIGSLALVGLLAVLASRVISNEQSSIYFYLFALIAVAGAARVITHPRPVYSALYFVLVVIAVASLLVLQGAEFLAVALIMIYAGAILVTYLFVIMLAHQGGSPIYDRRAREPFMAVLAGFVMMAVLAGRMGDLPAANPIDTIPVNAAIGEVADMIPAESNSLAMGAEVMTRYVVVVELSALLLLVSMIGAIALSRKPVPRDPTRASRAPLGQIGKEVEPF